VQASGRTSRLEPGWHPAFGSPRQDQVPLKLGEAAADREHHQQRRQAQPL
jgi:hypothetical protein